MLFSSAIQSCNGQTYLDLIIQIQNDVFRKLCINYLGRKEHRHTLLQIGWINGDSCFCRSSYKTSINLYVHMILQSLYGSGLLRTGRLGSELDPGRTLANTHCKLEVSGLSVEESMSISSWTIGFTYVWKKSVSSWSWDKQQEHTLYCSLCRSVLMSFTMKSIAHGNVKRMVEIWQMLLPWFLLSVNYQHCNYSVHLLLLSWRVISAWSSLMIVIKQKCWWTFHMSLFRSCVGKNIRAYIIVDYRQHQLFMTAWTFTVQQLSWFGLMMIIQKSYRGACHKFHNEQGNYGHHKCIQGGNDDERQK